MSVEQITLKANRLTDESLESTRRMVQMADESLNVGNKTLTMLDEQGEQLMNIKREVNHINQDIKQAQKNLDELSTCCCLGPFYRRRSTKREQSSKQVKLPKENKQKMKSSQLNAVHKNQVDSIGPVASSGPYIHRATHDEREDEMEKNLQQTERLIGKIKDRALEMNNYIDHQIITIDDIKEKVETAKGKVASAEKQASEHC